MAFTHVTRVRLHEADPGGVAFFATIQAYFHAAYEEALQQAGHPLSALLDEGRLALPLTHAEADYLAPLKYGARIHVTVQLDELRTRSWSLKHTIKDDDGKVLATGKTVHVCILRRERTPEAVPGGLKAALETLR